MTFLRSFVSLASVVVVASSASTGRTMTPVRATALRAFSIDFIRSISLVLMTRPTASLHLKQLALSVREASRLYRTSVTAGICTRFGETKDRHQIVNNFFY